MEISMGRLVRDAVRVGGGWGLGELPKQWLTNTVSSALYHFSIAMLGEHHRIWRDRKLKYFQKPGFFLLLLWFILNGDRTGVLGVILAYGKLR